MTQSKPDSAAPTGEPASAELSPRHDPGTNDSSDTISQERLHGLIQQHVVDGSVLALLAQSLKAGVLETMTGWQPTERGTPQREVISPQRAERTNSQRWPNRWFAAQGLFRLDNGTCAYSLAETLLTGEPEAGNQPVWLGERGGANLAFPYPYR